MAMFSIDDAAYKSLAQKFTSTAVNVSVSSTTATSTVLGVGRYRIVCDVPCYIKQGGSTVTAATTDHYMPADLVDYFCVTAATDGYLAAITDSPSGNLCITKQ